MSKLALTVSDLAYAIGASEAVARKMLLANNAKLHMYQNPNEAVPAGDLLALAAQLPPDCLCRIILLLLLRCGAT